MKVSETLMKHVLLTRFTDTWFVNSTSVGGRWMSIEEYIGTSFEASRRVTAAPRMCHTPRQTLIFNSNPPAILLIEMIALCS